VWKLHPISEFAVSKRRWLPSEMMHRVGWYKFIDVSEVLIDPTIRKIIQSNTLTPWNAFLLQSLLTPSSNEVLSFYVRKNPLLVSFFPEKHESNPHSTKPDLLKIHFHIIIFLSTPNLPSGVFSSLFPKRSLHFLNFPCSQHGQPNSSSFI
jgi:hypothetical protein